MSILEKFSTNKYLIFAVFIIIFLSTTVFLGFQNHKINKNLVTTKNKLFETESKLASTTQELTILKKDWEKLNQEINSGLAKINSITNQVQGITGSVDNLDKLVKTDPELLKKYSKVYFLSENYFPKNLTMIKAKETINPQKDLWFKKEALPFLENLLNDANNNSNLNLKVLSAFRSFETQYQLKTTYSVTYGANSANKFSADQGYSEHQLGTALDFTTTNIGSNLESFKREPEYKWLLENAYKYGFAISYPENNSYYKYEPWHWRFIGKKLAKKLHDENKFFYDLDQREIDSYLIYLFDK